MDQIIEELTIKEHKNLINIKYLSKALVLFLIFLESILLLGFRDQTLIQLDRGFTSFFDKLILDGVLYLL
jgi:hypothetical protein